MNEPFVKTVILDLTLQDEAQKKKQTKRYYGGHVFPPADLFCFCLAKIKIQQEHFLAWLEKGLPLPQLHSNTFCREQNLTFTGAVAEGSGLDRRRVFAKGTLRRLLAHQKSALQPVSRDINLSFRLVHDCSYCMSHDLCGPNVLRWVTQEGQCAGSRNCSNQRIADNAKLNSWRIQADDSVHM